MGEGCTFTVRRHFFPYCTLALQIFVAAAISHREDLPFIVTIIIMITLIIIITKLFFRDYHYHNYHH